MLHHWRSFLIETVERQFAMRAIMAILSGYIIGSEREAKGKNAGITTFTFVITGSMLFSFLSEHVDPNETSRIASQIVSGIGFLGAGLIFINDNKVKNLTTAASVRFAGAIGMAIGFGYYGVAAIATLLARLAPNNTNFIENKKPKATPGA